ncbi:hypothetical protein [Niallia sp. 01092]|uniref:hypothetical protein n=1 Tax=unclassified Niallia TaxID=2837522 RepID=UPI003FD36A2D
MEYLQPIDYEIAEDNGISAHTLETRFRKLGWTREQARSIPPKKRHDTGWSQHKDICKKNGISYVTYIHRVRKQKMSPEKASTLPLQDVGLNLEKAHARRWVDDL